MAKSGAHIHDLHSLELLNSRIKSSGEAMANIDQNVVSHINGVRDSLERQLDIIKQMYREAESRLSNAQRTLDACIASQVVNEFGEVVPSCEYEKSDVASAQIEVEKWQNRYERGQQILGECQQEIADYTSGCHVLIRTMCEQQTPKASQLLSDCIDNLQNILDTNVATIFDIVADNGFNGHNSDFSDGKHQNMQERSANGNPTICPNCNRPILLCSCRCRHV